jgi:hypothetical protein
MTLADVAAACAPPTTAQTIGRLETGTRTVSVGWLNRIAAALGVAAADLVQTPDRAELPVAALLDRAGAHAPSRTMHATPPQPGPDTIVLTVEEGVGDYRAGDTIWCERLTPDQFGQALNRDILAPRPAGRFAFGRLIQREGERLLLLPLVSGGRQTVLNAPDWIAVARRVVREL